MAEAAIDRAKVVFACVANAGRSQMAAAFFDAAADLARARSVSAGTTPGERVHPEVAVVMGEVVGAIDEASLMDAVFSGAAKMNDAASAFVGDPLPRIC